MFYRNEFQLVKRLGCCGGMWWGGNHGYSWSLSFVTTLSIRNYVILDFSECLLFASEYLRVLLKFCNDKLCLTYIHVNLL